MKGPGSRIDLDVRRIWECARCGRRMRAEGEVTAKKCFCVPEGTWMHLVEDRRHVRDPYQFRDPLSGTGGAAGDDEPETTPIAREDVSPAPVAETMTPPAAPAEAPQPGTSVPPPHAAPPRRGPRRRPNRRRGDNPEKPSGE